MDIYIHPTINVRSQDSNQLALEDNIDDLWHEWINRIWSKPTEVYGVKRDSKAISILDKVMLGIQFSGLISVFYYLSQGKTTEAAIAGGGALLAMGMLKMPEIIVRYLSKKEFKIYEALSYSPMRIVG